MKFYFTKLKKPDLKFYVFKFEKLRLPSGTKYYCIYFFNKYLFAVEL
jgi:hypothetical protein